MTLLDAKKFVVPSVEPQLDKRGKVKTGDKAAGMLKAEDMGTTLAVFKTRGEFSQDAPGTHQGAGPTLSCLDRNGNQLQLAHPRPVRDFLRQQEGANMRAPQPDLYPDAGAEFKPGQMREGVFACRVPVPSDPVTLKYTLRPGAQGTSLSAEWDIPSVESLDEATLADFETAESLAGQGQKSK